MPTGKMSTPYYFVDVVTGIVEFLFRNLVSKKLVAALRTFAKTFYCLAHTIRTLQVGNITATWTIHSKKNGMRVARLELARLLQVKGF